MKDDIVYFLIILMFVIQECQTQECDTSSDSPQCSEEQICIEDKCEEAIQCRQGADCSATDGTVCKTDYCQPLYCTATGQCVHGQVCSQDITRSCVYPVADVTKEGSQVKLQFAQPGSGGPYEEITWYKGDTASDNRIVYVNPAIEGGVPQYYGDYCSGSSPCETSEKGELSISTGEFTIFAPQLCDEDYYYYYFYIINGDPNTGSKYEIYLEVYITPDEEEITIDGLPDIVEEGETVEVTCVVPRIKPEAADIYWILGGVRKDGAIVTSQTTTMREDNAAQLECVVVPVYEEPISTSTFVNIEYAPVGKPSVNPKLTEARENEEVVLTCEISDMDPGNPVCGDFIWNMVVGDIGKFLNSQQLHVVVTGSTEGNYTCQCENIYGTSEISSPAEVILVENDISGSSMTGIAVAVVFVRRRRAKAPKSNKSATQEQEHPYDEIVEKQPTYVNTPSRKKSSGLEYPQQYVTVIHPSTSTEYSDVLPHSGVSQHHKYQNTSAHKVQPQEGGYEELQEQSRDNQINEYDGLTPGGSCYKEHAYVNIKK